MRLPGSPGAISGRRSPVTIPESDRAGDSLCGLAHLGGPRAVEAVRRRGNGKARDQLALVVVDAGAYARDAFLGFLVVEGVALAAYPVELLRQVVGVGERVLGVARQAGAPRV